VNSTQSLGAVFVFEFDGTDWVETAKINPPLGNQGCTIGTGVALEGSMLAVGASRPNCFDSIGAAYIFERISTTWVLDTVLHPSDSIAANRFGSSIDFEGNTLVIQASQDNQQFGAVYHYNMGSNGWTEIQKILCPDTIAVPYFTDFGSILKLTQDRMFLSAPRLQWPTGENFMGKVYEYQLQGNQFVLGEIFVPSLPQPDDSRHGLGFDIKGDTLLIGSPKEQNCFGIVEAGRVYQYIYSNSQWNFINYLCASDAEIDDTFGSGVSITSGGEAFVGATGDDQFAMANGALYFFDELPVGLAEIQNHSAVQIYPNPSSGKFTLSFPKAEAAELKVFDLQGKQIHREVLKNSTSRELDLRGYGPGIYLLVVDTDRSRSYERLVLR